MLKLVGVGLALMAFGLAWHTDASAQTFAGAESASAIPDFSGFWTRPNPGRGRVFRPLASGGPGPVTNLDETGEFRIGDHTNPILRPHAAEAVMAHGDRGRAGTVELPPWSLCWPSGVPLVLNMFEPVQFLQTLDQVTILYQRDMQVRRVDLNRPHPDPESIKVSWYGHSVGHYEGNDTLVIDTIALDTRSTVDRYDTPRSDKMRIVERYTIAPDRQTITVTFTVEDLETFTTPWSAQVHYEPSPGPIAERICAENNLDPITQQEYPIPVTVGADF